MIVELKRARALLEGSGWVGPDVEPFCIAKGPGVLFNAAWREQGDADPMWLERKFFHALDPRRCEVVEAFSVLGALLQSGEGDDAFELLERVVGPPAGLQTWLRASDRTSGDVLLVFTEAIRRGKKGERR